MATDLGEDVDDKYIKKMFSKADLDDDGFVTFDDFYNIMTGSKIYYDWLIDWLKIINII